MVVLGAEALGHLVVRQVRDGIEHGLHVGSGTCHLLLEDAVLFLQRGNLGLDGFSLVALALLHQHADLCGKLLGIGEVAVKRGLRCAAHLVEGYNLVNGFLSTFEVLLLQTFYGLFGLFGDLL